LFLTILHKAEMRNFANKPRTPSLALLSEAQHKLFVSASL